MAWLQLDGWEGRTQQPVEIVGQTPKRFRIRAGRRTRLAGRRYLGPDDEALVPRYAVTVEPVAGVERCES